MIVKTDSRLKLFFVMWLVQKLAKLVFFATIWLFIYNKPKMTKKVVRHWKMFLAIRLLLKSTDILKIVRRFFIENTDQQN